MTWVSCDLVFNLLIFYQYCYCCNIFLVNDCKALRSMCYKRYISFCNNNNNNLHEKVKHIFDQTDLTELHCQLGRHPHISDIQGE